MYVRLHDALFPTTVVRTLAEALNIAAMGDSSRHKPLYELMDRQSGGSPVMTSADQSSAQPMRQRGGRIGVIIRSSLMNARTQIVLRLPRGLMWSGGLAFVLLILLAYWAGAQRGQLAITGAKPADAISPTAAGPSSCVPINPIHLLKPGLYYWILVELPTIPGGPQDAQPEVERLVDFLRGHEVDAAAFSDDNGMLLRVVDLRGFTVDQLSAEQERYKARLSRLGQKWKRLQDGSTDFSAMRPEEYWPKGH